MTSWKRRFGKKTKKAISKLENRYDQWMRQFTQGNEFYDSYEFYQVTALETKKPKKTSDNK